MSVIICQMCIGPFCHYSHETSEMKMIRVETIVLIMIVEAQTELGNEVNV